jgi:hypothetical protein
MADLAIAQQAPPVDMDALAKEAEDFVLGRRIGAAAIWGGLVIASIIIGWVRWKARRDARALERSRT